MTETKGKKALSLCILRVLEQHAGKAEPLSTRQIIEYLKDDFGMIAERKAVGRNLLLLQEMGFSLSTYQDNGKGYYLKSADDAVLSGDVHVHDPEALDAFLRAPRSVRTERTVARLQDPVEIFVADADKRPQPKGLFETLDLLKTAIETRVQVTFRYRVVRPDGTASDDAPFTVSPYALFFAEGYYYAIVSVTGYGRLLHYRCDLMEQLQITETPARALDTLVECRDGLDVKAYIDRTIYQTDVKETHTLLCAEHLAGSLVDTFGDAVRMHAEGASIWAEVDAPWELIRRFLGANLKHATLLAPAWRRAQVREELLSALSTYPQS